MGERGDPFSQACVVTASVPDLPCDARVEGAPAKKTRVL